MVKFKLLRKIVYLISVTALSILVFACNQHIKNSNLEMNNDTVVESNDYKYYDIFDISPAEIIIPKNQSISQSLSIVVSDGNGEVIIFDGGRVEDADYLMDIIKERGGKVKYWFLTHIHDDHIGALISVLNKKDLSIEIENIYYDFASFDWYYKKMGDDAGIYYIFEDSIKEYNEYLISNNKTPTNILHKEKDRSLYFGPSEIYTTVLNHHLELDSDPINNTSIAYMVNVKTTHILILGDLGYEGGCILFDNNFLDDDSTYDISYHNLDKTNYTANPIEILVLSHHGQNGIDPSIYKRLKPRVVIWPTSKDIYENTHGRYYTDDTKKALSEISSIEYQIKSYEETAVIR